MSAPLAKLLKGVVGVIVLIVLVVTVNRWVGEYRTSGSASEVPTATSTAPPEGEGGDEGGDGEQTESPDAEPAPEPKTVVVLTDGLNFRQEASRDAKVIRGLQEGEEMTLIKTEEGWHYVEARDGTRGWISANPTYSEVR